MSLSKRAYSILFAGIVLLAIAFFATDGLNFTAWAIIFFTAMGLSTVGILMLIVDLIKKMKETNNK